MRQTARRTIASDAFRFSSGYTEYTAGCDPGYCAGYAGSCGYMDVCYEPEQHEQFYRNLVYSCCGLWEEAASIAVDMLFCQNLY